MNLLYKIVFLGFIFAILISCKNEPEAVADNRLNDYALFDANGGFHRLSRYNDSKAIVLWVQGNGCPIVRNALTDFNEIVSDYKDKGITFFMLNSNTQDNRSNTSKEASDFSFPVPVLMDQQQLIADALNVTITSEAIVLHPTTREVLYRGPLNNRLDYEVQKDGPSEFFLRTALDAILSGRQPASKTAMTRGCTVTRLSNTEKDKPKLTFTNDIAPVLKDHCVQCHFPEGIAPWAMTDYKTVKGWSSMMKQVLLAKRMPPWKADPEIGSFANSFEMPDSNARKIIRWIDSGMQYGEGEDMLTTVEYPDNEWQYGEPDTIINLRPEKIRATGTIPYRYQDIPLQLGEDKWLRGTVIKSSVPKALHHVVVTDKKRNRSNPISDRKQRPWTDNYIAIASVQGKATMFDDSLGVFIPKDMTLSVQLHYTTTGKPEEDRVQIGLYFADEPPKRELYALAPSNVTLNIPAYASEVKQTISDTISKAIKIHYVAPHMHFRGKDIKFSVIFPSGERHTLISIPDFNFNWQWIYKLEKPFQAPAGSVILVEGTFDNSSQNPLNPDPSQDVTFGIQSTDEMLIGFFNYTLVEE